MVMARFAFIKVIDDKTLFRRIENYQLKRHRLLLGLGCSKADLKKPEVSGCSAIKFLIPGISNREIKRCS